MRYALCCVLFSLYAITACKKGDSGTSIRAGDLAGTYIGTTFHKSVTTTSSGTYADSSTVTDTMIVTAITADSILLTKPVWEIAQPGFRTDTGLVFTRTRGTTAFNDHLDELTLQFNVTTHSLVVQKHYVLVSSWIMDYTDHFTGQQ